MYILFIYSKESSGLYHFETFFIQVACHSRKITKNLKKENLQWHLFTQSPGPSIHKLCYALRKRAFRLSCNHECAVVDQSWIDSLSKHSKLRIWRVCARALPSNTITLTLDLGVCLEFQVRLLGNHMVATFIAYCWHFFQVAFNNLSLWVPRTFFLHSVHRLNLFFTGDSGCSQSLEFVSWFDVMDLFVNSSDYLFS